MPSWDNTPALERPCAQCGNSFPAKRSDAKYCSSLCSSRARPPRTAPTAEQRRAWREGRLAEAGYRERVNAQDVARIRKVKAWIRDYKVTKGCVDCGYKAHHAALEFDHTDGKTANVSALKSIAAVQAEIHRHSCVVRCANCHRIKTFDGKDWELRHPSTAS
ncbi:hypothetical protein [Streptomyces fagopyri]